MNAADVIAALELPEVARLDRVVPKKLLAERAGLDAAERRLLNEGVESLRWVAALAPLKGAIAAFVDVEREYGELQVMHAIVRVDSGLRRLYRLVHAAIPYPVLLIAERGGAIDLSLNHKRKSLSRPGEVTLDDELVLAALAVAAPPDVEREFVESLGLGRRERHHLLAVYQGYIDAVVSLELARRTGRFELVSSARRAAARRLALDELRALEAEEKKLVAYATGERQISRLVEINTRLRGVRARLRALSDEVVNPGES